jgi:hypothetical protein
VTTDGASSSDLEVWRGLVIALVCASCSVITVRGPRTTPRGDVVCDASYVAPAIDAAITLAGVALIVWGAQPETNEEGGPAPAQNFAALPGLLMAIPFGLSTLYGIGKVSSCQGAARQATTIGTTR